MKLLTGIAIGLMLGLAVPAVGERLYLFNGSELFTLVSHSYDSNINHGYAYVAGIADAAGLVAFGGADAVEQLRAAALCLQRKGVISIGRLQEVTLVGDMGTGGDYRPPARPKGELVETDGKISNRIMQCSISR
jgi:hypothetical protein